MQLGFPGGFSGNALTLILIEMTSNAFPRWKTGKYANAAAWDVHLIAYRRVTVGWVPRRGALPNAQGSPSKLFLNYLRKNYILNARYISLVLLLSALSTWGFCSRNNLAHPCLFYRFIHLLKKQAILHGIFYLNVSSAWDHLGALLFCLESVSKTYAISRRKY